MIKDAINGEKLIFSASAHHCIYIGLLRSFSTLNCNHFFIILAIYTGRNMASQAQIQANRMNALRSTGPITQYGKEVSCKNSLKHGLLSKNILVYDEDKEELERFSLQMVESFQPIGSIEMLLVDKIINASWRLRRLSQVESEIFENVDDCFGSKSLDKAFKAEDGASMQILSRYETALEKSFYKALHELQRLQAMRLGQTVLAPIAIEFNNTPEIGFVS